MGDPAGDPRPPVNQRNSRECNGKFVREQWKVGAGKDHCIDPFTVRAREQRRGGGADLFGGNQLASELGFGQRDELGRSVADDNAVVGEARGEVVDIGLAHRRFGPENGDDSAA